MKLCSISYNNINISLKNDVFRTPLGYSDASSFNIWCDYYKPALCKCYTYSWFILSYLNLYDWLQCASFHFNEITHYTSHVVVRSCDIFWHSIIPYQLIVHQWFSYHYCLYAPHLITIITNKSHKPQSIKLSFQFINLLFIYILDILNSKIDFKELHAASFKLKVSPIPIELLI